MLVDGSQPNSPITNKFGAALGGSGTVGTVTTTDALVSPGGNSPGILTAQGNVTFDSASTFKVELDGANAGAGGYGQLSVTGTVTLGGSTLGRSLGFTPGPGESFTIVASTAPIVGIFSGLMEGASLTIGGMPFTISYLNDAVTLKIRRAGPAPTATTEAGHGRHGHRGHAASTAASTRRGSATTVVFVYSTDPTLSTGTTTTPAQAQIGGGTSATWR